MNNIQIKPYNPCFNPVQDTNLPADKNTSPRKFTYAGNNREDNKFTKFAVAFSDKLFSKDYEKHIDRLGSVIAFADSSLTVFSVGLQASVIADSISRTYFDVSGPNFIWQYFPTLLKVISIPFSMTFLFFAVFQGICEFIHLKRTAQLLINVNRQSPENRLVWIQNEYFSLTSTEIRLIHDYIEWKDANHSLEEKKQHFEGVADKLLKIKYDALKRRITPWLAEELAQKLPEIVHDLKSSDPTIHHNALKQVQNLTQNINTEGKKQISLYVLCLLALTISAIGLISLMVFSCAIPFMAFTAVAASLMFARFILAKGMLPEKGWHFSADNFVPRFLSRTKTQIP